MKSQDSDGSSNYVSGLKGCAHTVADSYDSITFFVSDGTFSGKYSVYGYNF